MTDPFPDDPDFEERTLTEVRPGEDGWEILDGWWGLWCPNLSPIEPRPGMTARVYGRGRIRGLFLNGRKVFYRTEAEDTEYAQIQLYGADATAWLQRWDAGEIVWTIEMGGLGPGYEQCIHIACAEILREMLSGRYDTVRWSESGGNAWRKDRAVLDRVVMAKTAIKDLGLSSAQWAAAMHLAWHLLRDGPRRLMNDPAVKERHIQVSNNIRFTDPKELV